jgi:predicted deacylase
MQIRLRPTLIAVAFLLAWNATTAAEEWTALELEGRVIEPGTKEKFPFIPDRSFEASYLNMPVFVARGIEPGPTLCITAGVHGDELNGVEVARQVVQRADPESMRGTVIALPAINAEGVRTGSRYLADRRDLNRYFPGREAGSVASLIANAVFRVIRYCDALVDLHTASSQRSNLPQIRADIPDSAIRDLAVHFGRGIVIESAGPDGSLRREAARAGVPAIIYEAGAPYKFEDDEIAEGVAGVENVMAYLDITDNEDVEIPETHIYERARWIRVAVGEGGFFFPTAKLGDFVEAGETLGQVIDPYTDARYIVKSTVNGKIIGMAHPQPVLSGYALFHVAWHTDD